MIFFFKSIISLFFFGIVSEIKKSENSVNTAVKYIKTYISLEKKKKITRVSNFISTEFDEIL